MKEIFKAPNLNEMIASVAYLLDTLRAYRNIIESGDCNRCGVSKECKYKPKPGQLVRYNCPFYERKDGEG